MSVPPAYWVDAGLWLAVVASGVYHGVNPGMGWPLAVSSGLMGKGRRDLIASLGPLGAGHFLAMAGILAPFAVMTALVSWQHEIRTAAGLLVIATGVYLLVARRHPRFLARQADTTGALVLRCRDGPWRGPDVVAHLSRYLRCGRTGCRPPGGGRAHAREPRDGDRRLDCPRYCDDRQRRNCRLRGT